MRKIKLLMFGAVLAALLALPGAAMAKSRDRDHDKMPDKWEKHFGLSTKRANAAGDRDKDGLSNLGEYRSRTNPRKADSNNDGIKDGSDDRDHDGLSNADEMNTGNNPCDRDTDNDGMKDGDEVGGTIVSFTPAAANDGSGVLVIRRADNSTITGTVNSTTEIECENEDSSDDNGGQTGTTRARHGADDGPNHDVGDDHGGDRNEGPGNADDDNGDDNEGNCTTADLTPGTVVDEAELNGTGDQAVFEKVELEK
jgi:hypothetical protein